MQKVLGSSVDDFCWVSTFYIIKSKHIVRVTMQEKSGAKSRVCSDLCRLKHSVIYTFVGCI